MWTIEERFVIDENTPPRQGGMAEVYKAIDMRSNGQPVAIKLFREGFLDTRIALEAFARETRALRELNSHPHIAQLLDYGTDKTTERKYIALEWLEQDLLDKLSNNPVKGWDHFYDNFGRPILEALCFAHSRGIIHRDVKPANVLISKDGIVRVSDFGISKYKGYYGPHVTLVQYASPPYAPPEREIGEYADTRDVYGFAVVSLETVNTTPLEADANIELLMGDLDAPPEIVSLLQRAVSFNPAERPANVNELLDELDRIQTKRREHWVTKFACYLRLTRRAHETLIAEGVASPGVSVEDFVSSDLNDTCSIDQFKYYEDGQEKVALDKLAFFSAEHLYQVAVDEQLPHRLVIINARLHSPSRLETLRDDAWSPSIEFFTTHPVNVEKAEQGIRYVFAGLSDFISERIVAKAKERESAIFDKWARVLRLQNDVQVGTGDPISYSRCRVDGNRITFFTKQPPEADIIDQRRLIRVNEYLSISGVVDEVAENYVMLYCDAFDEDQIPKMGTLVLDTRAAESALGRQQAALDAVKFDRCVRPDLRRLLVSPSEAKPPKPFEAGDYFQELDESQKIAILACLGTEDITVIEGPPGTGKTRFISELILQVIKSRPTGRILLSSQTHNALDNAIEKVVPLAKAHGFEVSVVRVGRRTDTRIAPAARDLLLENGVGRWLDAVKQKSQAFVDNWADNNGVDRKAIELGLAVAKLRLAKDRLAERTGAYDSLVSELKSLESTEKQYREQKDKAEELADVQDSLEVMRRDFVDATTRVAEARKGEKAARSEMERFGDDGRDLASFSHQDLAEWENHLLDSSDKGSRCRKIIMLLEEWFERFGRSIDFFGAYVMQSDVVAATCVSSAGKGLAEVDYDLCIVDEASKATPTEILVPLSRSRKWVIVGDPNQLPPFLAADALNTGLLEKHGLQEGDLKDTLLDHLIRNVPELCHHELIYQYRMVQPIGNLVSHCFYGGKLRSVRTEYTGLDKFHALPKPVTWFSTSRERSCSETKVGKSRKNFVEVQVIKNLLKRLNLAAGELAKNLSVVILSGYVTQVGELGKMVAGIERDLEALSIECNTVDAFQGREADVAIYSVTRSNPEGTIGFLKEYERLNVALSRGRQGLAIVGDSYFCQNVSGQNPFVDVLNYIRGNPETCAFVEVEA